MKKFFGFILGLMLLAGVAHAEPGDAVGALYRKSFSNDLIFTCTVSALHQEGKDLVLLTANHCVDEKTSHYFVTFNGLVFHTASLYKIPRQEPLDPAVDMALLKIPNLKTPVLGSLPTNKINIGDDISSVGFPLGSAKVFYKGYIAGRVDNAGSDIDKYLILQIFGAPGSSGTAVMHKETNKVIGVLVAAASSFGTPVIFATPIEYIKYLVTPEEKAKLRKR
jgi:hypothetical protein